MFYPRKGCWEDDARRMTLRLELFVNNVQVSTEFYSRALGFSVVKRSEEYVVLRNGYVQIGIGALAGLPAHHPLQIAQPSERKGVGVEIVLEVDDLIKVYKSVQDLGYAICEPLTLRPWGLRDFRLFDPDGYYLRITER